jgi:hypothetical protein
MSDKCKHESAEVQASYGDLTIMRCTWDCGQFYVQTGAPMNVRTFTAAELAAYRDLLTSIRETRHLGSFAIPAHVKAALELCEEQLAAALQAADSKPGDVTKGS